MKKVLAVLVLVVLAISLSACSIGNHAMVDFKHNFEEAVIALPDGNVVSGRVQSWKDYEDSDCVQIKIDGVVYLTHYVNATLIRYE